MQEINEKIIIAGFDPPFTSNLGWSVFIANDILNKNGTLVDAGIFSLPDNESERLLSIRDHVLDLIEKYNINVICMERSIGAGFAVARSVIAENTGVIKLVAASYDIKIEAIHTSTMALQFTGSGKSKGKKTRTKQTARDIFYPGQSFKSIACHGENECFEHLADSIGLCATYLLQQGISIEGPGGRIDPK